MGDMPAQFAESYRGGASMAEIARRAGISVHRVQYHLQRQGIPRRSHSEATYVKRNPLGNPFALKSPQTLEEAKLLGLGVGLYWGEGTHISTIRQYRPSPVAHLCTFFDRYMQCPGGQD